MGPKLVIMFQKYDKKISPYKFHFFQKKIVQFSKISIGQKTCVHKWISKKMTLEKNFLRKFDFLKFYVIGSTEFDFGDKAHMKVGVIAHQKI